MCSFLRIRASPHPFREAGAFSVLVFTFWESLSSCSNLSALKLSSRCIKYRSLPSDDPFGERASLENPSDGIFAGWSDVSQEQFAAAADSAAVRQAHFGPEWARFSTVGKMALQQAVSHSSESIPSPEQRNDKQIVTKRQMLERQNFQTYEEWVENMLGGEEKENTWMSARLSPSTSSTGMNADSSISPSASLEEKVKEEEDTFEGTYPLPLPHFMQELHENERFVVGIDKQKNVDELVEKTDVSTSSFSSASSLAFSTSLSHEENKKEGNNNIMHPIVSTSFLSKTREEKNSTFLLEMLQLVNDHLPAHLGHPSISIEDPNHWKTIDIIQFLTSLTPCENADSAPSGSKTVVDESMISAFQMAEVTGQMLLDCVKPPTLFRIMRKWHIERKKIAQKACAAHYGALSQQDEGNDGKNMPQNASLCDGRNQEKTGIELVSVSLIQHSIKNATSQLENTLSSLSLALIQETILQCFPYGYGRN